MDLIFDFIYNILYGYLLLNLVYADILILF